MPGIHSTLERQLTRHGILDLSAPPTVEEWYRFLERVSQTYADAEQERTALERQLRQATNDLKALRETCSVALDTLAVRVETGAEPNELLSLLTSYRPVCEGIGHRPNQV